MKITANEIAGKFEWGSKFCAQTEVRARQKAPQFNNEVFNETLTEENKFK